MNKKLLISLGIVALIVIMAIVFYSSQNKATPVGTETPKVKIGHLALPHAVFVAKDNGYFDKFGVNVELVKFSNSNLVLEALARGEIDGTDTTAYSTLFAFDNKSPGKFKIYFGASETKENVFSYLIVKKNSGISSPTQLKNKKIVMRSGLSSKSQAELVVKQIGLEISDVEFVPVDATLLVQTFAKPEIDAFLDVDPFATIILEQGIGQLLLAGVRPTYIFDPYPLAGAVLSTQFLQDKPEVAKKFIAAQEQAIDFIMSNPSKAKEIFQKYLNLEPTVATKMSFYRFEKLSQIDKGNLQRLIDLDVKNKILDSSPILENLFLR